MSDTNAVPRPSRRRRVVIVGLVLVTLIGAAVGAAVIRRRSRPRPSADGLFGLVPALQKANGELARGLTDGGTVSARFVSDLRAGRWHEAYQSTSRRFRQRMDEAGFERFVKESPPLNSPVAPIKFAIVHVTGGASVTIRGAEEAPKGGAWLLLVSEDGALKVERLALSERVTP